MAGEISILDAMARIGAMAVAIEVEQRKALGEAARVVQAEAKAEIGTYQRANTGQFDPWPELADATKEDRVAQGYAENEPLLREGDLRDSIEMHVEQDEAAVGSDSDIAVYQELGTPNARHPIPARSFLGVAGERKAEEVARILGRGTAVALAGPALAGKFLPIR